MLLVAHIDTVHDEQPPTLCYDPARKMLWSPDGLGADDRAGVWGILEVLKRGYRPHVLFTDQEESGGGGAISAARDLKPDVRFMIEMDRRGDNDCVFYSCVSKMAVKYCESFGFKHAEGSFTDISILMPSWRIAGVNLGIGYYNQHTFGEYLRVDEALHTIDRVCKMMESPPLRVIEYEARPQQTSRHGTPTHNPLNYSLWGDDDFEIPEDEVEGLAGVDQDCQDYVGRCVRHYDRFKLGDQETIQPDGIYECIWCGDDALGEDVTTWKDYICCKSCLPHLVKDMARA